MADDEADSAQGGYRHCQSLTRGLELLAALNRCPGGAAAITELARATGLHRTTVKRLLETLREAGYVESHPATHLYALTFRVQKLSMGFRDNVSITDIAWPWMRALSKAVVWPCSLLTLEGDEMVVRASTRSFSPLSFHPGMPGRRLPLLTTAAGRAYLAFAPAQEQQAILSLLSERDDASGQHARDPRFVDTLIRQTRNRGYALNHGEWGEEPKFGGIAVPLRAHDRVVACLNVIFLLRGVKDEAGLQGILGPLQANARAIEEDFADRASP